MGEPKLFRELDAYAQLQETYVLAKDLQVGDEIMESFTSSNTFVIVQDIVGELPTNVTVRTNHGDRFYHPSTRLCVARCSEAGQAGLNE